MGYVGRAGISKGPARGDDAQHVLKQLLKYDGPFVVRTIRQSILLEKNYYYFFIN